MIRVAIVEDEEMHARNLEKYLNQYAEERGVEFSVKWFPDGINFISDYNGKYDVVFMDIEMPHMNGMHCAEKLRELDNDVMLIFVTNMVQYAVKGYEVDAMGYIVKPINYVLLCVLMDKVAKKVAQTTDKEIHIKKDGYVKVIPVRDLLYVEVRDHYLVYHTANEELREIGRMKDVEKELSEHDFFRCDNSYLINLRYVSRVQDNEVMVGNDKVYVSRRRKKELLLALNDFFKRR